jgi:hypothetical protein
MTVLDYLESPNERFGLFDRERAYLLPLKRPHEDPVAVARRPVILKRLKKFKMRPVLTLQRAASTGDWRKH